MDVIQIYAIIIAIVLVASKVMSARTKRDLFKRDTLLGRLGFTAVFPTEYRHRIGGVPVRAQDLGAQGLRVTLALTRRFPFAVESGTIDPPLGDPDFDTRVHVEADRTTALAYLSADKRKSLATLITDKWRLTSSGLERNIDVSTTSAFVEIVTSAKTHLHTLATDHPQTISEGLLERVRFDPLPAIRLAALEALTTHFELGLARPALAPALAHAITDRAPEVRLFAALRKKDPHAIASVALDTSAPTALRSQAATALTETFPNDPNTLDLIDKLARHLRAEPGLSWPTDTVAAVLSALSKHPEWSFGERLLPLALQSTDEVLALAAIDALERSGGLRVIPLLTPHRDRILGGRIKTAARRAIEMIQARSGGPQGALAIAEEGGALALSDSLDRRQAAPR